MKIEDAVYNALLFAPRKGELKLSITGGEVRVSGECVTVVDAPGLTVARFRLDPEGRRLSRTMYLQADVLSEIMNFTSVDADSSDISYSPTSDYPETWLQADNFLGVPCIPSMKPFAVNPDRLSKFSLLRPRATKELAYPLDLETVVIQDRDVVRWRYGPDAEGVLFHLNRKVQPPSGLWYGK